MDIKEIKNLIKFVAKYKVSEVKLEIGEIKVSIKTGLSSNSIELRPPVSSFTQSENTISRELNQQKNIDNTEDFSVNSNDLQNEKLLTIKSPIIGTFYIKPSPDKPPFVSVGSEVKEGEVLCVIEAMKLFDEIESDIQGKIVKILVEDSTPVEFDEPLFLIEPI